MFLTNKKTRLFTTALAMTGLMLCLTGCNDATASTNDTSTNVKKNLITNIDSGLDISNDAGYETCVATITDIYQTCRIPVTFDFFNKEEIRQPYEYGRIFISGSHLRHTTSSNDKIWSNVKEGEPVITYSVEIDPEVAKEAQANLERAEAMFEKGKSERTSIINSTEYSLSNAKTQKDRKLIEAELKNLRAEYEQYVSAQEEILIRLREKNTFLQNGSFSFTVNAPFDGVVECNRWNQVGTIPPGGLLMTFYKLDEAHVITKSTELNYGDTVSIANSKSTFDYTFEFNLTGKVISAPNLLAGENSDHTVITFDDFSAIFPEGFVTLIFDTYYIDSQIEIAKGALTIPPAAIEIAPDSPGNTGIVTLYNNGDVYNINVTYAYMDDTNVWITSGLKEGDVVVLK